MKSAPDLKGCGRTLRSPTLRLARNSESSGSGPRPLNPRPYSDRETVQFPSPPGRRAGDEGRRSQCTALHRPNRERLRVRRCGARQGANLLRSGHFVVPARTWKFPPNWSDASQPWPTGAVGQHCTPIVILTRFPLPAPDRACHAFLLGKTHEMVAVLDDNSNITSLLRPAHRRLVQWEQLPAISITNARIEGDAHVFK
jgi:hypothetical protein